MTTVPYGFPVVSSSANPCMEAAELFATSVSLIERVARAVCRRGGVYGPDADDFVSTARLAVMEDDYAVLRRFEGRSSLPTYLTVILQRLFADEHGRAAGRWHVSAAAERMGPAAVALETMLVRDGRSLDEALPFLRALDPELTRERATAMAAQFPARVMRPHAVAFDDVSESVLVAPESADALALEHDATALRRKAGDVIRDAMSSFTAEDRVLVRLRFANGMTIADISRMVRLPQRPLYRRLEALLGTLRTALAGAAIDANHLPDLLADDLDFGFRGDIESDIAVMKETS